jgi:hypothetical protein
LSGAKKILKLSTEAPRDARIKVGWGIKKSSSAERGWLLS